MLVFAGCERPTLALLHEDSRHARHLKCYEISLKDKVGPDLIMPDRVSAAPYGEELRTRTRGLR